MKHAACFLFILCAAGGCRSDDPPSPGSPAEQTDSPRGAAVNPEPGASPTIVSPTDPAAPPPSTAPARHARGSGPRPEHDERRGHRADSAPQIAVKSPAAMGAETA